MGNSRWRRAAGRVACAWRGRGSVRRASWRAVGDMCTKAARVCMRRAWAFCPSDGSNWGHTSFSLASLPFVRVMLQIARALGLMLLALLDLICHAAGLLLRILLGTLVRLLPLAASDGQSKRVWRLPVSALPGQRRGHASNDPVNAARRTLYPVPGAGHCGGRRTRGLARRFGSSIIFVLYFEGVGIVLAS